MKIFIIHGSYGNKEENWFPWIKEELEKEGHVVFIPEFSTPENQSLDKWTFEFSDGYGGLVDEDSILIGHSLGPAFILSLLEKLNIPKPLKACFFVSGFLGLLNNEEFDKINKTFTTKEFDWKKIKQNCEKFHIIHSDNDPYVPLEKAKELAVKLDSEVKVIPQAGHFNESSGYTSFPELLNLINEELKWKK